MSHFVHQLHTPIGGMVAVTNAAQALCALQFAHSKRDICTTLPLAGRTPAPVAAPPPGFLQQALTAYFDGDLIALDDIVTDVAGTPFQQHVWSLVRAVPAGTTTSYGALATQCGNPGLARAIGAANAANPVALVIACHRILASNGTLAGYAWGMARKQWLLDHEHRHTCNASDR